MAAKYQIIRDPEFGYLRTEPIPTAQEVEEYYRREFYASDRPQFNDSSLSAQQEMAEKEFNQSRFREIADVCAGFLGVLPGLSLLDIGCGYGETMLFFRRLGMKVRGLDPSPEAAEHGREHGLDVQTLGIESLACLGGEQYSIVTLLNVLEHLRHPGETLRGIRRLLTPGGILVIDVPNEYNALQITAAAEYGLGEWWVAPPSHINYFDPESLASLLEKCGYNVCDMAASFPMELFLLMGEKYVGDPVLGKKCHAQRVLFEQTLRKHGHGEKLRTLYRALAGLGLGRQVLIYARVQSDE